MVMHPHTKYQWPISKDKNVMAQTRKYFFFISPWCQRSRSHEGHYGTRNTALWLCTHIPNIIDLSRKTKMLWPGQDNTIQKTIIWPGGQRSRSHKGHYGMRHTALWSCTHIPNKYYLKNNYLTLRSKVKVPRRSLRYTKHRLMVMHPHTKYHWPISKDKNVMVRISFAEKKQKQKRKTKKIRLKQYVSLLSKGRHK
jgi:hypothetical protein